MLLPGRQTGREHWSADDAPDCGVVVPGGQGAHAAPDPLARHVPRGQGSQPPSLLSCSPKTLLLKFYYCIGTVHISCGQITTSLIKFFYSI